jgi:hypothetical protein
MARPNTYPRTPAEVEASTKGKELAAQIERMEAVDGARFLMSTKAGRREVHQLMHRGFRLPGQRISNVNGSLQSSQLGGNYAVQDLYDRIRHHCHEEWRRMIDENKSRETNND